MGPQEMIQCFRDVKGGVTGVFAGMLTRCYTGVKRGYFRGVIFPVLCH